MVSLAKGTATLIIPCLALTLSGCASIVTGTSQQVTVDSNPGGAKCLIYRNGARLHEGTTPMTFSVDKSMKDLNIACADAIQREARGKSKAGIQPWVFGNIILGGLIGIIIDIASGAVSLYDSPVMVNFDGSAPVPAIVPVKPNS